MSQDNMLEALKAVAEQRSIGDDQLRAMLDDEVRALSSDARVHDYIHVFAIRHLRERMRRQDELERDTHASTPRREPDTGPSRRL
ncbi:hypothetical protein WT21_23230 [Burkholderia territorii]|uniref:DUF3562 domain-containing protein n=1 Tax=Burkholderia territorii TaxID=1503055 RepID=UPI000752FF83|nr:DUF3562 domain-containing protein [Burkholderia territorii]KVL50216.1 hypothetical protein WT00_20040 [Burkholderia territorii]KVQ44097.1 hypothetical protein WT21_23230 [Burkholderia territorii]KWE37610.1 hypothetical protein WT49_12435 [Burkholderia territorii]KWE38650.1 hypothetical protein WT50_21290 [Burkholderia territorii]KWE40529.1 hypothetical protein WT51_29185 [Burkholderia territorii]